MLAVLAVACAVALGVAEVAAAGGWVVSFDESIPVDERARMLADVGLDVDSGVYGTTAVAATGDAQAAQELRAAPGVESVVADRVMTSDAAMPTDPYYAYAWSLPAIGWERTWPSTTSRGAGATIAVIEKGFNRSLPDFSGSVVAPWNFKSGTSDTWTGSTASEHGTWVSSVALARANNGAGVVGVAPEASFMPLVASYDSEMTSAVNYAVANGAQVINVSMSRSGSPSSTLADAFASARAAGVLAFCSSSNTGAIEVRWPAGYEGCSAVGAVDENDAIAYFSTGGPHLDLTAPGVSLPAVGPSGSVGLVSGTSFSTPTTAGAAAVMRGRGIDAETTLATLRATAVDVGDPGWDQWAGNGRIDIAAALAAPSCSAATVTRVEAASHLVEPSCTDDGSIVGYEVTAQPATGSAAPQSGKVGFTPPSASWIGTVEIEAVAIDDAGHRSAPATITLDVTAADGNRAPDLGDDTATTDEDVAVVVDVLANDTDIDAGDAVDPASVRITVPPVDGVATVLGDGSVRFEPAAEFAGQRTLTYEACDTVGACATATLVITVTPVNDAPSLLDDAHAMDGGLAAYVDVLDNDLDPEGGLQLTRILATSAGSASIVSWSTIRYVAPLRGTTSATVTYEACDDGGLCGTADLVVSITPAPNRPPNVGSYTVNAQQGIASIQASVLNVTADPDGDAISASSPTLGAVPAGISASVDGSRRIVILPDPATSGQVLVPYTMCDVLDACTDAVVTINLEATGTAPVAVDDAASVDAGATVDVAVTANDSDVDGNLVASTVAIVSAPSLGTASVLAGGTVRYVAGDVAGDDALTYRACDATGLCDTATLAITVVSRTVYGGGGGEDPVVRTEVSGLRASTHGSYRWVQLRASWTSGTEGGEPVATHVVVKDADGKVRWEGTLTGESMRLGVKPATRYWITVRTAPSGESMTASRKTPRLLTKSAAAHRGYVWGSTGCGATARSACSIRAGRIGYVRVQASGGQARRASVVLQRLEGGRWVTRGFRRFTMPATGAMVGTRWCTCARGFWRVRMYAAGTATHAPAASTWRFHHVR